MLSRWRLGTSLNVNNDPLGDRKMQALFAGFRTGPSASLAEIDFISDELPGAETAIKWLASPKATGAFERGGISS